MASKIRVRQQQGRRQLPATTADRQRAAALAAELNGQAFSNAPILHPMQGVGRLGAALAGNVVEMAQARREQEAIAAEEAKAQAVRDRLAAILRGDGGLAPDLPDLVKPAGSGPDIAPDPSLQLGGIVDPGGVMPAPAGDDPVSAFLLGGAAATPPSFIPPDPSTPMPGGPPVAPLGASLRGPGPAGAGAPGGDLARRRRAMAAQLAGIPGMEGKAVELALKEDAGQYQPIADPTALGLPKGTVAQLGPDGKIHIVNKPEKAEAAKAPVVHDFVKNGRLQPHIWDAEKGDWRPYGEAKPEKAEKEDQTLVEIYDAESPTGTRMVRRADAIGKPGKPGSQGMKIYDRDGKVVAEFGGKGGKGDAGGLAPSAAAELDKSILANEARLQRLTEITASYQPGQQLLQTKARNAWRAFKDKTGMGISPEDRQALTDYTVARRRAWEEVNQTIKDITGASMGVDEAHRLRAQMPDPENDSPTEFEAKLADNIRQVTLSHARMIHSRKNGIADPKSVSLQDMNGIIQKRGREIDQALQASVPDEKRRLQVIRSTLKQEFGI